MRFQITVSDIWNKQKIIKIEQTRKYLKLKLKINTGTHRNTKIINADQNFCTRQLSDYYIKKLYKFDSQELKQ